VKIKRVINWAGAAILGIASLSTQAAVISLFEYGFNIDGVVSDIFNGGAVPGEVNVGGFNVGTGLGTITATISGAGAHSFDAFFDHDIDQLLNFYFNEIGATGGGAAATGQSWEIDEPGFGSPMPGTAGSPYFGDIFNNFVASTLDNQIFFDAFDGQSLLTPDDVSMALGWDFALAGAETAIISMMLSEVAPAGGFFLEQHDPDSQASIFLSSTLTIRGGMDPIPEPSMVFLLGIGLTGLVASRRGVKKA
jgi:hypothetical protein